MEMQQRYLRGNELQAYYVDRIRQLNKERDARLAALKTKADAEAYVADVRKKIAASFPMPERGFVPEYTVVCTHEYDGFRVDNVIYYSRPGFPVTANLYVPAVEGKVPAVVFVCGHAQNGKLCDAYSTGAITLARRGYAVLLIDPAGQGERLLFTDCFDAYKETAGNSTREHNMVGKQLGLCGEFFGAWRAYDAIRGLDLLLSLPQVDASRVGITGNSGGGTMTTFIQAVEPRFTMAAPSCYVTTWKRNIENEIPADAEQMPPGILGSGCEMADFIVAYAPRPVLILGQKKDFFDARGTLETYEQARKIYALLGCEENVQCFIGPRGHGYAEENRNAMYDFFCKHAGVSSRAAEPAADELIPGADLLCTSTGQVGTAMPYAATINSINCAIADELAAGRTELDAATLKSKLRQALALPETIENPYYRVLRAYHEFRGKTLHCMSRHGLEVQDGMLITIKLITDDYNNTQFFPETEHATLYVANVDAAAETFDGEYPDCVEDRFFALDVRGVGESSSLNCDVNEEWRQYHSAYGTEYHYNALGEMWGEPMLGRRVLDVLTAIAYLKSNGVKKITLQGKGIGSVPALFAGLLSDDVDAVKLEAAPRSYDGMIRERFCWWPASVMLPGILKFTDLPQIYKVLRQLKPLTVTFVDNPRLIGE